MEANYVYMVGCQGYMYEVGPITFLGVQWVEIEALVIWGVCRGIGDMVVWRVGGGARGIGGMGGMRVKQIST